MPVQGSYTKVVSAAAKAFEVPYWTIKSPQKLKQTVWDARAAAVHILRTKHDLLFRDIDIIMRRNNCAKHSVKRAEALLETDPAFKRRYKMALELINEGSN